MDLRFTDEENAFREEVRSFIRENLPKPVHAKMLEHRALSKDEVVSWQRILNARGWATPSWPAAWGGPGWTAVQRYIFLDELHQFPAPEPVSFNVSMIGPVIGTFGSDEQKARLLPRIANLDDWWCQGFSEPGAGSDLAALSTSAIRHGDHYVVNGTKMWQGMGHRADWMFTLVRTDPAAKKQAGISFLLIDMKSPGLSVQPIITIDGRHEVNSVFLDNVRVPVAQRVYLENKGWDVAKFLLGNERTGIARIGMSKYLIRRAKQIAAQVQDGDRTLAEDAGFRRRCAEIEVELKALEITQMRVLAAMGEHAEKPDPRSSILKIKGVELRQAASELLLRAAGPLALAAEGEYDPPNPEDAPADTEWGSTIAPVYFILRAASIYGGATEVQKNILAQAVLGLPK
ncbi:MAG: pimeloyl-CoA dehydrogenase, large subunit [Hydrocarboniphaga sp.]|uniref:acyl-CoA dehydrogenase family protein n=1 Tax=Hydrocarboniphaga sp. TaxID=2033016 RepID=UPI00262E24B1|nr:acyl-CoA dehydrogenase family protein [Hydrocarboniphaga sp.]MDB5972459.1 pimeloyl-CoA dehydrogenase, large subunit [Hydrocarboniphaga sp.]